MENTSEIVQNTVESASISSPELSKVQKLQKLIRKVKPKTAIVVTVVVLVLVSAYVYKGLFIVATVNGSPISRFAVIDKLEKASGKQVLESLITEKLIRNELDKQKVIVTGDEISADLKKIEGQVVAQGGTLAQALMLHGMTQKNLEDQISLNLRVEKLLADKIKVEDSEVIQYIKDNKVVIPKGQEAQYNDQVRNELKSDKLYQASQEWVSSIRSGASINFFVNY